MVRNWSITPDNVGSIRRRVHLAVSHRFEPNKSEHNQHLAGERWQTLHVDPLNRLAVATLERAAIRRFGAVMPEALILAK